jgi:hypothetical protein
MEAVLLRLYLIADILHFTFIINHVLYLEKLVTEDVKILNTSDKRHISDSILPS